MADVQRNLEPKNRDKFTQVRTFADAPSACFAHKHPCACFGDYLAQTRWRYARQDMQHLRSRRCGAL